MAHSVKQTQVTVSAENPHQYKGDILVAAIFQDTRGVPKELALLDKALAGGLGQLLKLGDFQGRLNESALLYTPGKVGCKRLLVVGLGKKDDLTIDRFRQASGTAIRQADKVAAERVGMYLHWAGPKQDPAEVAQALTEGAIVGRYDYRDYLPDGKDSVKAAAKVRVTLLAENASTATRLKRGCKVGTTIAQSQNQTRMMANKPGNEINPPELARQVQKLSRQAGLKCTVFTDTKLKQMGMNALLAVGSGSATKPRLIQIEYKGRAGSKAARPDVVIVGKAITFDSGGLSLKPSASMETMKFDKCGGCAVLGTMLAAAGLKLKLNVIGLIPSAENMPSHTSYRPGDILKTYSGKTVEVLNTDAEGRLILCDALAYGAKMKPKTMINLATLTGACVVALGSHKAGLFGNNEDLLKKLQQAADQSGEAVWPLPSGPEYLEQMKSKVADLKNIGGREGGSCTAAAFLGQFVGDDFPWAHIDIAGVADTDKEKPYRAIGATGFGVRVVSEYLRTL